MSMTALSQGEFTALTILLTPSGVVPSPQWFSSPSITPYFSAAGNNFSIASMTQGYASSSVYPGSGGSMPRLFMRSVKDFEVPHRPVFILMMGAPRFAARMMLVVVFSIFFCLFSLSGVQNVWCVDMPEICNPCRKACFLILDSFLFDGSSICSSSTSTPSNPNFAA